MTALHEGSVVCPVLIGRAHDLESLHLLIEEVRDGQGRIRVALVCGEAGVGKSRLVAESKIRAARLGMLILEGRCFEPDRALPYAPLLDLLRAYCGSCTPDELLRDLGRTAQELVKLLPELAVLLPGLVPTPALEPEQEKGRLFHTLAQFFIGLAAHHPLLVVVEESAEQFAFRHALTRHAVYSSLLARERKAMHHRIAEAMEWLYPEGNFLDAHLADLAYHYYEAGAWAKALKYSRQAGEKAQAVYAPRAAVEHFTHALESAQQLSAAPPPNLYHARGQAYETLGEFEQARADYESAQKAARVAGDRKAEWQALLDLGMLWAERDYARTGDYCQRALALARDMGDPSTLAHSLNRLGNWHMNSGRPLEAVRHHREALDIFQELNDRRGLAQTLDLLGMASMQSGDLIQSRAYYEQAVALLEALDDRQGLASSLASLAFVGGTFQFEIAERAVKIAHEIGWRSGEAYALIVLGIGLGFRGDYGRALDLVRSGLAIAEEIEHREWTTAGHCYLGMLYLDLLALPEAQEQLERTLALAHEIGSGYWIQSAAMRLVEAHVARHDLAQAKAVFEAAFGPGAPVESMGPLALLAQSELALAGGNGELALQCVDRVSALMANAPDNFMAPLLSKWRGEALAALQRDDEAETALLAARKAAEAHGLRPYLWRIHLALGNLYHTRARRAEAESAFAAARTIIAEMAVAIPDPALCDNFVCRAAEMMPPAPKVTPRRAAKKEFGGLTAREREVAALIAQGKLNREIAGALVVGERTVEAHVGNILSKLGFASRSQIAVWAIEKRLK